MIEKKERDEDLQHQNHRTWSNTKENNKKSKSEQIILKPLPPQIKPPSKKEGGDGKKFHRKKLKLLQTIASNDIKLPYLNVTQSVLNTNNQDINTNNSLFSQLKSNSKQVPNFDEMNEERKDQSPRKIKGNGESLNTTLNSDFVINSPRRKKIEKIKNQRALMASAYASGSKFEEHNKHFIQYGVSKLFRHERLLSLEPLNKKSYNVDVDKQLFGPSFSSSSPVKGKGYKRSYRTKGFGYKKEKRNVLPPFTNQTTGKIVKLPAINQQNNNYDNLL